MRKTFALPAAIIIASAPFLAPSIAVGQDAPAPMVTTPSDWLSVAEIAGRLAGAAWIVLEIETELSDGNYEVCLLGADGNQIEARVDPMTGEITSQAPGSCLDGDDDDDHNDDNDREHDDDDDHSEDEDGDRSGSGDDGRGDSRD